MSRFPYIPHDFKPIGFVGNYSAYTTDTDKPLTFDELRAIADGMPNPPKPTNFSEAVAAGYEVVKINGEIYAVDMKAMFPFRTGSR